MDETISAYASRISEQIKQPNPTLLAISFGGLIAIELSKLYPIKQILLISTVKTTKEIPWHLRLIGRLGLHKMISPMVYKRMTFIAPWFFGVKTNYEKELLKNIINDTSNTFLTWAINQLLIWDNYLSPKNTFHIHGDKDRLLPAKNPNILISNAGHLMILKDTERINKILELHLKN